MGGAEWLAYQDGIRAKRRGEASDANPYADLKGKTAGTLPPLAAEWYRGWKSDTPGYAPIWLETWLCVCRPCGGVRGQKCLACGRVCAH